MANQLLVGGTPINSTKKPQFENPDTGAWVTGTLDSGSGEYRVLFSGLAARTIPANTLKMRLEGTTSPIYTYNLGAVTILNGTVPQTKVMRVAAITPDQSNGAGAAPVSGLAAADKLTNSRVKIWNPYTQTGQVYQQGVNDLALTSEILGPGYEDGFGPDNRFRTRWLADNEGNTEELFFWKFDLSTDDPNAKSVQTWIDVFFPKALTDWNNFKAWAAANGYGTIKVDWAFSSLGEQDSFLGTTQATFLSKYTQLLNLFFSNNIFAAGIKLSVGKKQRNPAQWPNDATIAAAQAQFVGASSYAFLLGLANPTFYDTTHYTAEAELRMGDRWYEQANGLTVADPRLIAMEASANFAGDGSQWVSKTGDTVFLSATPARRATLSGGVLVANGQQHYQAVALDLASQRQLTIIWLGTVNNTGANPYARLFRQSASSLGAILPYYGVGEGKIIVEMRAAISGNVTPENNPDYQTLLAPFTGGALRLSIRVNLDTNAYSVRVNGVNSTDKVATHTGILTTFCNEPLHLFADSDNLENALIGSLKGLAFVRGILTDSEVDSFVF